MTNLLAFIILFGVLVFVHELGHFLMAKYFKIGVEKFSLGFGPKIFGKKVGDTEYLIGLLPLGGYVKMVGDEPIDEQKASDAGATLPPNSFLAKPPWQRIMVVLMGPISNLVLPIALFFILYMVGQPTVSTQVGYISQGSAAAQGGLVAGDRILSVDGTPVQEWGELTKQIETRAGKQVVLNVEHQGSNVERTVTPTLEDGLNPYGEAVKVGRIGVVPQSFKLMIHVPDTNSAAYKAGFRSGDTIIAVGRDKVRYRWQLESALKQGDDASHFTVLRNGASVEVTMQPTSLANAGIYWKELVIDRILPDSIASEKGLKTGDILFTINGKPIQEWFSFQEQIRGNKGESLSLTVIRDLKPMTLDISPRVTEQKEELTGEKIRQRMLGITTTGDVATDNIVTMRVGNPLKALSLSFWRCYEIAEMTIVGFGKLIAGKVSAKSLGGPLLIYQLAGKSWESGFHAFMQMLVLISITLGVLNLLPIPVLDGGHLLFYLIEMFKGSPVQARTREWAQQIGVVLLVGLMLFAFYNDLGRVAWNDLGWLKWIKQLFT